MTQFLGTLLADSFSRRRALAFRSSVLVIMTALVPTSSGIIPLLPNVRNVNGASEGVIIPSMNALCTQQVRDARGERAVGFVYSGMFSGPVFSLVLPPVIPDQLSYNVVVYLISGLD